MIPHKDSTKRESRIRTGDGEIKDLPTDVHTRLAEVAAAYRYPTHWSCATRAIDLGLSVMEIHLDRLGEIINGLERS